MRKRVLLLPLFIFIARTGIAPAQKTDVAAELQALVRAEREFAKTAAVKGTRAAFLENLADDGIVFRPGPVNGKKSWEARPAGAGLLSWEPVYADVARAGDLGYTTGPWEFRPQGAADKPIAQGHYMTIWKKQSDGAWKFVLDLGTQNSPPQTAPPTLHFAADFRKNTARDKMKVDVAAERKALLKMERELSQAAATKGAAAAFDAYAADDLRLMREGSFPIVGKQQAVAALAARPGAITSQLTFADASRAGDLGYTYGTYTFGGNGTNVEPSEQGNYVRIWKKRDHQWRVVLDLLNPVPAAQN